MHETKKLNLTTGEKILLLRRRKKQNQYEAASSHGMPHHVFGQLERTDSGATVGEIELGEIMPHEYCFLMRRRAKLTQAFVAKEMNICRWWLNQLERGEKSSIKSLMNYWEAKIGKDSN